MPVKLMVCVPESAPFVATMNIPFRVPEENGANWRTYCAELPCGINVPTAGPLTIEYAGEPVRAVPVIFRLVPGPPMFLTFAIIWTDTPSAAVPKFSDFGVRKSSGTGGGGQAVIVT